MEGGREGRDGEGEGGRKGKRGSEEGREGERENGGKGGRQGEREKINLYAKSIACVQHYRRYHSPTAYSAVSMSPIELSFLNLAIVAPLFMLPLNATVFVVEVAYIYYFGLMDHSGVMMDSWFPWQPHTKFHDDHHR